MCGIKIEQLERKISIIIIFFSELFPSNDLITCQCAVNSLHGAWARWRCNCGCVFSQALMTAAGRNGVVMCKYVSKANGGHSELWSL